MASKIVFCSKFPDIPDNADKVSRRTRRRRRRRRTQAIAKRYAFHANVIRKNKLKRESSVQFVIDRMHIF